MEFQHKTVLINGGASGMGLLSAQRFASAGGYVVIADVNMNGAKDAASQICASGGAAG